MKKVISFLVIFICSVSSSLAEDQGYELVLQRQAKQIQELQSKLAVLEQAVAEMKNTKAAVIKEPEGGDGVSPFPDPKGESSAAPKSITNDDTKLFFLDKSQSSADKKDYDLALATLKESNFEEAEQLFANFLQTHSNSKLAENAIFWYGESFYRRELYNKAAINFLQGYKRFPKGVKAADSLLKLSLSLANLNKEKEACSILDKLDAEFPDRPINSVNRAKEARSKFGCKN